MQIYDSYIEAGQQLSQRDKERFYTAVIEYLAYDKKPQLKGSAQAVFTAIEPSLNISKQNAKNGRAGGKRKSKRNASETGSETQANAEAKREANSNSNSKEKEKEKEKETSGDGATIAFASCPECGTQMKRTGAGWFCETCGDFGQVWTC